MYSIHMHLCYIKFKWLCSCNTFANDSVSLFPQELDKEKVELYAAFKNQTAFSQEHNSKEEKASVQMERIVMI